MNDGMMRLVMLRILQTTLLEQHGVANTIRSLRNFAWATSGLLKRQRERKVSPAKGFFCSIIGWNLQMNLRPPIAIRAIVLTILIAFGSIMFGERQANAQDIPPTSPCTPGIGQTPAGWTDGEGSPDCSTPEEWGATHAWDDAPLPAVPTGDTTFLSMIGGPDYYESILTTMNGLVPGRTYRIPFYAIGRASVAGNRPSACEGLKLTTSGANETIMFPDTTAWEQSVFVFTAVWSSQTLEVAAEGTSNCLISFALGAEVIEIIKTVSEGDKAGDVLTFTMTIENQGIGSLTGVAISEENLVRADGTPLTADSGPTFVSASSGSSEGTLVERETAIYTLTYTLTQEDIDAGGSSNQATAEGTDENGNLFNDISSDTAGVDENPTSVMFPPNPDYDFVKKGELEDANVNRMADGGELINYTFSVENTGNVTLTDIVVEDYKIAVSNSPIASLLPGESNTDLTGAYEIKQEDIDNGFVENLGTATAKDPQGNDIERLSRSVEGVAGEPTTINFETLTRLEVDLIDEWNDTNGNDFPDPGEPIVHTFVARHTGNVTIDNITISSLQNGPNTSGPPPSVPVPSGSLSSFAPGSEDRTTFQTTYELTQADIDAGGIVATATDGAAPNDTPVSDISDKPDETADVDLEGDWEPDDAIPTPLPQNISLALEKHGELQSTDEEFAEAGDTILYTFKVTNDGNVTATDVVPSGPGPRFNGRPGSGELSSFTPASGELGAGESITLEATYTMTQSDIDEAQGIEGGIKKTATARGKGPAGQEVISPEDEAVVDLPGYAITKVTPMAEVARGGRVPYTIRVKSLGLSTDSTITVIDMTPPGLTFVRGSALLNGSSVTPVAEGRKLTFKDVALPGEGEVLIDLELGVTAAAKPGEYVNKAWVEDLSGEVISRVAEATVEVVVEAVFDCGDILGKVFDDRNRNGYQDAGEPGLPGVRIATVKGLLLTADDHGRFHVACADLPDQRIGTNYIMKLDPRSLPSGYRLTTENPRVVRLTAGKASEFMFGASIGRVVRLDLTDAAFVRGAHDLMTEWRHQVSQLINLLEKEPSILRLVYAEGGEGRRLANRRVRALRRLIANEWRDVGRRYQLEIETRVQSAAPRDARSARNAVYK
ncbi:DUF11 domain-containing protein [Nitratireductor sp. B36]|uniref:DUF7507 domain-containing protein n=1 Tax=Nitratireductor sp. B36 TaxID=2762059 RepID=UPI001E42CC32|nr:DUF11 domain-containing protein [Nitratireductor sp. B36]